MDNIPKHSYAFIDGSFNPYTDVYGCGGFLVDQHGVKHIIKGSGSNPELAKMRNVAGEIFGVKKVINLAKRLNMKELIIFYDYEGIAKWPKGEWAAKNPVTKRYANYIYKAIKDGLNLSFQHVKAHSGIPGNEMADKLAKEAVGLIKKKIA